MPKVTDLKSYYREQAAKAGLSAEKLAQVDSLLEDPAFLGSLQQGFKPLPDYSHDMDETRTRTEAAKMAEYNDWYTKTKGQHDFYTAEIERLKALGLTVNGTGSAPNQQQMAAAGMTKEQIDAILNERLTKVSEAVGAQVQAAMEYGELRELHVGEFKKPLDRTKFEEAWRAHPEWGGNLRAAYQQFTEPERATMREADMKAKVDARYEEGVRDGFSRRSVPADAKDREFSPFFNQDKTVKTLNSNEQESASREAFFEGLREAQKAG